MQFRGIHGSVTKNGVIYRQYTQKCEMKRENEMRGRGMDSSDCGYGISIGFGENNNKSSYSFTSLLASGNYLLKKYYVTCSYLLLCTGKGEGKAHPRTGHESQERE
jgi:hypothetical protein